MKTHTLVYTGTCIYIQGKNGVFFTTVFLLLQEIYHLYTNKNNRIY